MRLPPPPSTHCGKFSTPINSLPPSHADCRARLTGLNSVEHYHRERQRPSSAASIIRRMKNQARNSLDRVRLLVRPTVRSPLARPLLVGVLMALPRPQSFPLPLWHGSPPFCCLRGFPTSISSSATKVVRNGFSSCCLRRCKSSHRFKSASPRCRDTRLPFPYYAKASFPFLLFLGGTSL